MNNVGQSFFISTVEVLVKFLTFFSLMTLCFLPLAQANSFGLGVAIGTPTVITGKYWTDSQAAIDGGVSFFASDFTLFYGDYLYHYPGFFKQKNEFTSRLKPYLGVGGILVSTTKDRSSNNRFLGTKSGSLGLAGRFPIGAEWMAPKPSLGVFAELAPSVSIVPTTEIFFQLALGVRYFF